MLEEEIREKDHEIEAYLSYFAFELDPSNVVCEQTLAFAGPSSDWYATEVAWVAAMFLKNRLGFRRYLCEKEIDWTLFLDWARRTDLEAFRPYVASPQDSVDAKLLDDDEVMSAYGGFLDGLDEESSMDSSLLESRAERARLVTELDAKGYRALYEELERLERSDDDSLLSSVEGYAVLGRCCREYMEAHGIARTQEGAYIEVLPFHYPRDKAIFEAHLARHRGVHSSSLP